MTRSYALGIRSYSSLGLEKGWNTFQMSRDFAMNNYPRHLSPGSRSNP